MIQTHTSHAKRRKWLLGYRIIQTMGLPGLSGVVLIIVANLYAIVTLQAQHSLVELKLRLNEHQQLEPPPSEPTISSGGIESRQILPERQDSLALIRKVHEAASSYSLVIQAVDYRHERASLESLGRLEMHVQLRGDYRSTRLWMQHLHGTMPSIALQDFNVSRPNADVAAADIKVTWVIAVVDNDMPATSEARRMALTATPRTLERIDP